MSHVHVGPVDLLELSNFHPTMENKKELENIIRSLLISTPKVTKANKLECEFKDTEGRPFPFRELGFSSFVNYLKSIPSAVKLVPYNSHNPDVLPVVSEASSHIDKLVSKQRLTVTKKSSGNRRGNRNIRSYGAIPPRRRPIIATSQTLITPKVSAPQLSKGVSSRHLENHFRENFPQKDLTKNGIQSGNDSLHCADDLEECIDERVYPKMLQNPVLNRGTSNESALHSINFIPKKEDHIDDEFWISVPEEGISNYTIDHFTHTPFCDSQEDANNTKMEEENCNPQDYEPNVSKIMIENFRKILAKYPEGVWATELPQKYLDEFGVPLELQDLGYNSAIQMASYLPNVFQYRRAGSHDWKLYDARRFNQAESMDNQIKNDIIGYDESETLVPKSILENIKTLVKERSEGFRSTLLLPLYEMKYKKSLDFKTLGFNRLEDFLEVLKKVITIRKVKDYYLLLPKHHIIPLETADLSIEDFKLPMELPSFFFPDNVLKPINKIPYQDLPPIKTHGRFNEPLMELEVRVAEVISPSLFFLTLDSKHIELETMMEDLDKFYKKEEKNFQIPLSYLSPNLICACKYENYWHRAKVVGLRKNDTIEIEFIDYGTPGKVKRSELRLLQSDFAQLPAQAVCAQLLGIQPRNGENWPKEVAVEFLKLVQEKRLLAHVYKVGKKEERLQLEVILFNTSDQKHTIINEYLVEKQFAEFINKEISIPKQMMQQFGKEDINQTTNHAPTKSAKNDQGKRTLGPPPGFKIQDAVGGYDRQHLPCHFPQPSQLQSQLQINKLFSCILPGSNPLSPLHNNLSQQINQNLIQTYSNISPMNTYNNQINNSWPTNGILHNFPPFYNPYLSSSYPQSQYSFFTHYSHQNTLLSKQPFTSSPKIELNNMKTPQNTQYFNDTSFKMLHRIPGWSSDLSLPQLDARQNMSNQSQFNSRHAYNSQPQMVYQKNTSVVDGQVIQNQHLPFADFTPKSSPVPSATSYMHDASKKLHVSTFNLAHSTAEVTNIYSPIRHNTEKSSVTYDSGECISYESRGDGKPIEESLKHANVTNSSNSVFSQSAVNSVVSNVSCKSEEYVSAAESLDNNKQSSISETCVEYVRLDATVHTDEEVPDSWEDILPDDTPAKAKNIFYEQLEMLRDSETDYIQLKINNSPNLKQTNSEELKVENLILKTKEFTVEEELSPIHKIQIPSNWKDGFDPDITNGSSKTTLTDKIGNLKKPYVNKQLIQKLEIEKKSFHVICVKNKLAVVCCEFYQQFTPFSWNIILLLIGIKSKTFVTIKETDEPSLFSELRQVEFCGGVSKKDVFSVKKLLQISYLSEVPEVFALLNLEDKVLFSKLKEISEDFNCD